MVERCHQCARGGRLPPAALLDGVPPAASEDEGMLVRESIMPDLLPDRYMAGRRVPDGGLIIRPDAGLIDIPLLTRNMIRS